MVRRPLQEGRGRDGVSRPLLLLAGPRQSSPSLAKEVDEKEEEDKRGRRKRRKGEGPVAAAAVHSDSLSHRYTHAETLTTGSSRK